MSTDIALRATQASELEAIWGMEQGDAREFIMPYSLERHREEFAREPVRYLGIEVRGRLIGFVILSLDGDGRSVEFRRIVVAEPGRGYGSAALRLIEGHCAETLGRRRIWLDVFERNARARHIYERHGYTAFGSRPYGDRTLVLYEKSLVPRGQAHHGAGARDAGCVIRLDELQWEPAGPNCRGKQVARGPRRMRLVEFQKGFVEDGWCEKGHVGYVLEGELAIEFCDRTVQAKAGDCVWIDEGYACRHRAHVTNDIVRLVLFEEVDSE